MHLLSPFLHRNESALNLDANDALYPRAPSLNSNILRNDTFVRQMVNQLKISKTYQMTTS